MSSSKSIHKIALINMPFGGLHIPSLALTQLKAVFAKNFGDEIQVDVLYINHDFASFIGVETYRYLSDEGITTVTGLTDWMFRKIAFPDLEDNESEYVKRYRNSFGISKESLADLLQKREQMDGFLDELIIRYSLVEYDVVGFTSMFDQMMASFAMARKLKKRNDAIITIIGGASCELSTGQVIARKIDCIDYVFSGPGLKSIVEFTHYLQSGQLDKCEDIKGVYTKQNIDRVLKTRTGLMGEDTDINVCLPLDYNSFLESLNQKCPDLQPELFFETSRGCWWGEKAHCTFCGLNGISMNYRTMTPENALNQFQELFGKYPEVPLFFAVDNILDTSYFETVFPNMKVPENSNVFYETKVITKEENMKALADAGITAIQPGIEALSTSTLKLMKKGTTAFQNIHFLKMSLKYGITPDWNLLIGFPKESHEVYEKYVSDIPWLIHLPPPGATFPVRFDRYSPYHTNAKEYGLELKALDYYSMLYPFFSPQEIEDFAYFFADHNYDNPYLLNLSRWRRKVNDVVNLWIKSWDQSDGKLKPELLLRSKTQTIYDSRSKEALEFSVDPLTIEILKKLDRPMGISTLQHQLKIEQDKLLPHIELLLEKKLVFQEGKNMMSIVCLDS